MAKLESARSISQKILELPAPEIFALGNLIRFHLGKQITRGSISKENLGSYPFQDMTAADFAAALVAMGEKVRAEEETQKEEEGQK